MYFILRFLEEKRDILELLKDDFGDDRLSIHIGSENKPSSLKDCSVVTRGYKIRGKAGRLGVIGPKRMLYEKVVPMVEFLADTVTEILGELESDPHGK